MGSVNGFLAKYNTASTGYIMQLKTTVATAADAYFHLETGTDRLKVGTGYVIGNGNGGIYLVTPPVHSSYIYVKCLGPARQGIPLVCWFESTPLRTQWRSSSSTTQTSVSISLVDPNSALPASQAKYDFLPELVA